MLSNQSPLQALEVCNRNFRTFCTICSLTLTLIVPRAWEIGYTQPCIKCQGKTLTHFVYFWSRKTLHYTHLEATSYILQQGQSLHFWTTSLFTTGCYKNKYTTQFLWMACISRFATAILNSETELALGTVRVKSQRLATGTDYFLKGYRLDDLGSIPGVQGVEIFLCSFMPKPVLGSIQAPIKWVPGTLLGSKCSQV